LAHQISNRLKSLLPMLHDEADELLQKHGIYDILTYGWADAETPDDEYVGLAMWQTDPPFKHDWATLFKGRPPRYTPNERDEILLRNGEDFTGAVLFARRSLGMALCFAAVSDPNVFGEDEEFWHQYATTIIWLTIATDRLRDFFLMARFGKMKEDYGGASYSDPFKKAVEGAPTDLQQCLVELSGIAEELQKHRLERNKLVHEVATKAAQRSLDLLHEQRRLAAKTTKTISHERPISQNEELATAIEKMKLWYRRLIKASSLAFEFEYFNRIRN
jgi:hypothetical protein